jgi:hypothetical protein
MMADTAEAERPTFYFPDGREATDEQIVALVRYCDCTAAWYGDTPTGDDFLAGLGLLDWMNTRRTTDGGL